MKNKIVTHFYVKEEKEDDNGEAPIYLRITVNGKRAEVSTNRRINPELWDKSAKRVAGRSEPTRAINAHLDTLAEAIALKWLKKACKEQDTLLPWFRAHPIEGSS